MEARKIAQSIILEHEKTINYDEGNLVALEIRIERELDKKIEAIKQIRSQLIDNGFKEDSVLVVSIDNLISE